MNGFAPSSRKKASEMLNGSHQGDCRVGGGKNCQHTSQCPEEGEKRVDTCGKRWSFEKKRDLREKGRLSPLTTKKKEKKKESHSRQ